MKEQKLSWRTIIGYGFGEAGTQFSWTLISTYLTIFYTDVVGLTPLAISVIMLVARIWDAVNDPMFGIIAEQHTHTRWGRFRPYIILGAPVLALTNCLTFFVPNMPVNAKALWCAFTYILCGMAYTAVSISVGSLANCITTSNRTRVLLNSSRNIIGNIAALLLSACTMPIILHFGEGSTSSGKGYFMAALIFSIICIPCLLICGFSTKETVTVTRQNTEQSRSSFFSSILNSLKDHDSRTLILAMILVLTAVMGRVGIMSYYFIYVYADPTIIASCASALTFGMILPGIYAPFLLNRFNKKIVGTCSCFLMAFFCAAFYFAGESHASLPVLAALHFLYGASNCAAITCFGLIGEIVDDVWVRTEKRSDGVMYAMVSFGTKLGNAIGGSVGILALAAVGFAANSQMSSETLTNMDKVINFGPAAIFILAGIFFSMIRMTNEKGRKNELLVKNMMAGTNSPDDHLS